MQPGSHQSLRSGTSSSLSYPSHTVSIQYLHSRHITSNEYQLFWCSWGGFPGTRWRVLLCKESHIQLSCCSLPSYIRASNTRTKLCIYSAYCWFRFQSIWIPVPVQQHASYRHSISNFQVLVANSLYQYILPLPADSLQILHTNGNHWIAQPLSTFNCDAAVTTVYDLK